MVKPIWISVAFVAGIAVGVVVMRISADAPAGEVQSRMPPAKAPEPPPEAPALTSARNATRETAAPAVSHPAAEIAKVKPVPTTTSPGEPAVDPSAAVQPIDAGDVFNKMISQPSQPGFENNIGDAHRALERETRDEGWAYTMEGEIQNAMVTEVSTGAFRSEHVECRATMCELRLSGKGDQAAAIKRWSEELGSQPFGQRLFLNYSSSISDNDRVDTLLIFRRPPKGSGTPRTN